MGRREQYIGRKSTERGKEEYIIGNTLLTLNFDLFPIINIDKLIEVHLYLPVLLI